MANPYEAPKADLDDDDSQDRAQLATLASGQKLVIYAILLNLGLNVLAFAAPQLGVVVGLAGVVVIVMSIVGVVRMARGLGQHVVVTVLLCVLMIVPCVNLLVLVSLSSRATGRLRAGGYEVGLLGART